MGTGQYYGISDSAERGSLEISGKAETPNAKVSIHSSSAENKLEDEHPTLSDGLMRADNDEKGATIQ